MRAKPCTLLFVIVFCCTGCSIHRPLEVADQARLIKVQDKSLRSQSELVQQQIATAKASMALVIAPMDPNSPIAIYPTKEGLTEVVADHLNDVARGSTCFLVYDRSLPIPPQEFSCSLLKARALDLQNRVRDADAARSRMDGLEGQLRSIAKEVSQLSKDLDTERAFVANQEVALEKNGKDIRTSRADIDSLAGLLGPTASLVKLHDAQLKAEEKTLDLLIERYTHTADAVGKNNEQIDAMIQDLNKSFAQVSATLDQIQQKLATIQ